LTEDKENLSFEWFVCWRIPGKDFVASVSSEATDDNELGDVRLYVERFMQSVGTVTAAERRLEERIQAAFAAEIGRTRLSQLVSLDEEQLELEAISERVTKSIREIAADQFGIEVLDVRLQRFGYPESVKPAVYAEIRSERERVAVQYRAEGASEKAKIESQADLRRVQLLAQAQREATTIRGEGEAKAIEIFNAAHSQDPEFYEFLKTLETYRSILDDQTTVVLSADSPLLKLLTQGMPEREPSTTPARPETSPGDRSAAVNRE
jgi:membrane protease subunit HflC